MPWYMGAAEPGRRSSQAVNVTRSTRPRRYLAERTAGPDPDESAHGDHDQRGVDGDQDGRMDPRRVALGRKRPGVQHLAPDPGAEAEPTQQDQDRAAQEDYPLRHVPLQQLPGTHAAGQGSEPGANPGGVGPFGGEGCPI